MARVVEAAFGRPGEVRMVEAIRASAGYVPELAFVAEDDGEVVGHVMLSYVGSGRAPTGGCSSWRRSRSRPSASARESAAR